MEKRIEECLEIDELMAIEGNTENIITKLDEIIQKPEFEFIERTRRPPRNNLNTVISLGNSLRHHVFK